MSVYVYSVFVLSCVQVTALRQDDPLSKESYRLCNDQETEKATEAQQRAVDAEIFPFLKVLILLHHILVS
jgi:hypothetical protein